MSGECGHLYLAPEHREKAFSSSPLSIMLAVDFLVGILYHVDIDLFHSNFSEAFFFLIINGMEYISTLKDVIM